MTKILILGASGFIGNTIYRELCSYFDTYGTYYSNKSFAKNQHFVRFDMETDGVDEVLKNIKPTIIISALRGGFEEQIEIHQVLVAYIKATGAKVIFFSSANVFDAFSNYPSYEFDKTLSESKWGKLKIKIETMLMRVPERYYVIARLPMVFGKQSPRVQELTQAILQNEPYEVFPDLVMNAAGADKLAQQIHYIINRKKHGIFHLGSHDLVHHNEFIEELRKALLLPKPIYKNVYTSNFDRYLAVIPKERKLPKHLTVTYENVIEECAKK